MLDTISDSRHSLVMCAIVHVRLRCFVHSDVNISPHTCRKTEKNKAGKQPYVLSQKKNRMSTVAISQLSLRKVLRLTLHVAPEIDSATMEFLGHVTRGWFSCISGPINR